MNFTVDINKSKEFLQNKQRKRKESLDLIYKKYTTDFQKIVEMIIEKYKPEKIYQWGSLIDKTKFSEFSDIDVALEGIQDAETFFNLLADAEDMTEYPVDIVELEKIHSLHKEMIIKNGKLVYERK